MKLLRIGAIGLGVMLVWASLLDAQQRPKQPTPPEGVKVLRDLQYLEGGHQRNRLDLYLPAKAEGRLPLVVWIHGGAWLAGSKEACPAVPLTAKGYAVASINYRLSQHAVFPAQIEDCKAAIRWLRANGVKYQLDPDHIGVWGSSAGGHLVALLGTTGGVKDLEGHGGNLDQSSRVQCVVDWYGPSELLTMGGSHDNPNSPEARLIGVAVQDNKEKARKASPLTYVSKDSTPFLIMHGDKDNTVPLSQSRALAEALKKAGVEIQFRVMEGNGHGGPGFNTRESRKLIEDFFAKHLGKGRSANTATPYEQPRVLVTISKQTTYITEPLRKDGFVDYLAALNQRCREGITQENNATIPLLKAIGLGKIAPKHRDEYCRMLGIKLLPEKGDYYVDLEEYVHALKAKEKPVAELGEKDHDAISEQLTKAMKRPWSKKEFPVLAGWLAANERPMVLLVAASKCPRSYDPLISEDGQLIGMLLPTVTLYREAVRVLTTRAMFRVDEGKIDEAWEDLLACHRLARLAGQGPTLVESLVAVAVDSMACAADQGLLQHVRITAAQAAKMRDDLGKLPPMPKIVDKIVAGERLVFLDCVGTVCRKGISSIASLLDGPKSDRGMVKSMLDVMLAASVDWDQVLRMGNSWYDRMADACRKPTRADRRVAMGKIESEIFKLAKKSVDLKSLGASALGRPREEISRRMGELLLGLFLPPLSRVADAEDSAAMRSELNRLAFALAAYRADHGSYPAKLAHLKPKYLTEVPKDIFIDAALHYTRQGDGYLLYSVGRNEKDDGGKGLDDCKAGDGGWDDLAVRMPATGPAKQ